MYDDISKQFYGPMFNTDEAEIRAALNELILTEQDRFLFPVPNTSQTLVCWALHWDYNLKKIRLFGYKRKSLSGSVNEIVVAMARPEPRSFFLR